MSQISHALDEEHQANLALLGHVEAAFARVPSSAAVPDAEFVRLATTFADHLERDIARHFGFEEAELFPRMSDAGDGDLAELLTEEHEAIRAVAGEILPLTRAAAGGTLDTAGWRELRLGVQELVEREIAHIQKETMALLPLLDQLLDDDMDRELAFAYATT
ncbi:MAG: hemerythrin domain-containing protein [Burkholderiales bacterium]|nr:hemerythrin domain-containing protein [Burkholderiales bacterium]